MYYLRKSFLLVVLFLSFSPTSLKADIDVSTKKEPQGIKIVPSAVLTGGLLGASVVTVFLPRPSKANFTGPMDTDAFLQNNMQQPTEELRSMHSQLSDAGMWINASLPLASYGLVAWASSGHRSLAQVNRTLIGFQAFFANYLFTTAIKNAVARERPVGMYGNDSFPSGHSSGAFTGAFLLFSNASPFAGDHMKVWRYSLGSAALVVATATAALRMSAGRHYLSDVVVGAGSGFLFGYLYPMLLGNGETEASGFIPAHVELDPFYRHGPKMSVSFRL